MSTTAPSGWCSPCCSPRAHAICQDRVNRGLLACTCPNHLPKVEKGARV